jgi:RNA polymerase sigma factor (sigma-70 family)
LRLVEWVRKQSPDVKVIVMDLIPVEADIVEFVKAGVSGFILKDATFDDFLGTIRSVAAGVKVLPPSLTGSLFSQIVEQVVEQGKIDLIAAVRMTKREREVIDLIAEGLSNKEIAQRLNIATYTVKSHIHNILEKLALHTRLQVANYAHTLKSRSGS